MNSEGLANVNARSGRASRMPLALTLREQRIASLVAARLTNEEIAERLGIRPRTVEWNLTRIYRKLGVRSRTGLAASVAAGLVAVETPWDPPTNK